MSMTDGKTYKTRVIDAKLSRYLKNFGAVCVEGPKWCGKTWTSSHQSASEFLVGDPAQNFQNRTLAELSPALALTGDAPRLMDEWQEVPALWDAVRHTVDQRGAKAQFILTGSSMPKRKGVLHSGGGRIGILRMRTMSLFESGDSSGVVSLEDLCDGRMEERLTGEVALRDLIYMVVRGGWPGNLGVSERDAGILPQSYIRTILDDDVPRLDQTKYDIRKMELLLRSLARNESATASHARLLADILETDGETIDRNTVIRYLDVFRRLFLLDNQPPFSSNIRSSVRLRQSEKLHLCDPALTCALLRATPERLLGDLNTFGFVFEALCERDLRIYAESFGAKLFHYQDYRGRKVDAVLELADGRWCAFEIRLGAHQIDSAAGNLLALRDFIGREPDGIPPSVLCVVCGLSNAAYRRSDGVYVVPITALRN